ncbi:uncharacterized protein LOC117331558 isoform X1 [Pecten maximus]|uniref:uncharacterized protein LOC117331558 isoform X1 n=1 Tax=Pecten maximus TaxID=6579 RepID=UPI0014585856|nr:uncharacterized protein LOC117331558 isoform X1 [Pecten maximus]XP_033746222.1 uncharacterized protein LOC117331558 isoform X1 [Pecten maximus]
MFLPCVLVFSMLFTACLAISSEIVLDHTNCLLRQTYKVDKMGVLATWRGARLENCLIKLARDTTKSEAICVDVMTLNISKGQCPPDIQMFSGNSGTPFQVSNCDTSPVRKCMTSEFASLKLEANESSSILAVRISTDTDYQSVQPTQTPADPTVTSGLPLSAIIGIMIGVFIPVIIVVIVVAVICIRRTNKPLDDDGIVYHPPKIQEPASELTNGSTDIDPSLLLHSPPTITDDDDISQEISQSMRLSAIV